MRVYAPDYYKEFKCLAGACRHSCCIGWQVDIDEATLAYYRTVPGAMGRRLQSAISCEGTPHFVMGQGERCPFLNSCGLCDIMTQLGMDKVSDICAEHPRFYNFYSDRREIGLGLGCEAVAALLVTKESRAELICLEDDGAELLWGEECDLLDLRDGLFDILQDRQKPVAARLDAMLAACGAALPQKSTAQWADAFLALERLDEAWTEKLQALKTAGQQPVETPWFETALEQLAVYFIYRHLTDGFDADNIPGAARLAAVSVELIRQLCCAQQARTGSLAAADMAEICRMYSAEVEYSEENTRRLMEG